MRNIIQFYKIPDLSFHCADYETCTYFNVKQVCIVYRDASFDIPFIDTSLTDLWKAYDSYPMIIINFEANDFDSISLKLFQSYIFNRK